MLVDGNPAGLYRSANPLLQDMYVQMRTKLLRPRVIVDYDREPFVLDAGDVVTIAAESGKWLQITSPKSGWVSSAYIKR